MPFRALNLSPQIVQAVRDAGYTEPTPIQVAAIPLISAGHDIIGIAQTGTGKTAAFVLPILMKLAESKQTVTQAYNAARNRQSGRRLAAELGLPTAATGDARSVADEEARSRKAREGICRKVTMTCLRFIFLLCKTFQACAVVTTKSDV